MTSRPRLKLGRHMLPGLVAVALFVLFGLVFLDAGFGDGRGFEAGAAITASIGYAMFNLGGGQVPSEGFLVAFIAIAFVLDAALEGAVMLARRDDESVLDAIRGAEREAEAARTDGGEDAGTGGHAGTAADAGNGPGAATGDADATGGER